MQKQHIFVMNQSILFMQANKSSEQNLHFEYTNTQAASLVRGIVREINARVRLALVGYYESGRDLCQIRRIVGYGKFTRWLKSSEWEYSARAAYKFITIYERSVELGIQMEWFGTLLMISGSELLEILTPEKQATAVKLVELLKAGKKVNREVLRQINPVLKHQKKPGEELSNQALTFDSQVSIYTWKGLRFRSNPEVKIAIAFEQQADVAIWPNCRGRLNTPEGRRNLEPDFLVCYKGKLGILEVDGPFHTPERRVEEQERERYFRNCGIRVIERFDYKRCEKEPLAVVEEFLLIMRKMYSELFIC
ncbi:DUF3102 domain-containing protein [Nostoc calcicola FACHB-3891]|nr:DUF3102 domain-containing protein [Nostoc calcicola FACHB-3891]